MYISKKAVGKRITKPLDSRYYPATVPIQSPIMHCAISTTIHTAYSTQPLGLVAAMLALLDTSILVLDTANMANMEPESLLASLTWDTSI